MLSPVDPGEKTNPTQPTSRKVSIQTDPAYESRLSIDSIGNDFHSRRKSQNLNADNGPARKISINVQSSTPPVQQSDNESTKSHKMDKLNGDTHTRDYINQQLSRQQSSSAEKIEESWIFAFCMKCRVQDNTPSWEPPYWQKLFPYPLCPSFRQFSNFVSIVLIGLLIWITTYVILGDTAAPGGQLFSVVVLSIAANFGGFLISLTTLPRLVGMLAVGILFQNLGWVDVEGFGHVTADIRKIALTIILTRAGLEIDPEAFKKVWVTILKLGLVPWTVECCVVAVMSHFIFGLPWTWAFSLGAIMAAVAPAVVVPCLFRLRKKGYGVAKGIPTCILAVAGIDDATSVAVFGIIASMVFSEGTMAYQISQAPVCILGGLAFGVLWGQFLRIVPEKGDTYLVPIRILLLLTGGAMIVFGSEKIGYEGAGPLGVVFAALVANHYWIQQGWEIDENPVGEGFEIFWMIFEPILFGLTGTVVKINELDGEIVSYGIAIIVTGVVLRILATIAVGFGDGLNTKEKLFVALSWMAKAIVQAALGPVFLKRLEEEHHSTDEEKQWAKTMSMICVLSIILTAPLGALLIAVTGSRLLTKTAPLEESHLRRGSGWTRRPSLYDLSIKADDEEDRIKNPELRVDKQTTDNTNSNQGRPLPIYTVEE